MNFMLLEVRKFSPGSNRELNQLRSLDVWDEISVATHPDEWTGRRGARLSICEYSHTSLSSKWLFNSVRIAPLKLLAQTLNIPVHTIPHTKSNFKTWKVTAAIILGA
jgi:methionyl-tRNA formyltransferase